MTFAQRDLSTQCYCMLISRHTHGVEENYGNNVELTKVWEFYPLFGNVLCFAIAIVNFDSEHVTQPQRE